MGSGQGPLQAGQACVGVWMTPPTPPPTPAGELQPEAFPQSRRNVLGTVRGLRDKRLAGTMSNQEGARKSNCDELIGG